MAQTRRPADEPLDTIIPAGSINRIPLYPGNRPGRKALVTLRGRPLLAYVLDALTAAECPGRLLVVGPREVVGYAGRWPAVEPVPEQRSLMANVRRGLAAARTERVLFCNPDQPLLRPEMVDHFVREARGRDADLVLSWVRLASLGRYEQAGHKFAAFGDDRYAHGNLFLARSSFPALDAVARRLDRLYRARKSTLRFAWAMGPALFSRFLRARLTGRLPSLDETLDRVGREFGLTVAAVVCPHPEIVLDIDEPGDYAAAARYMAEEREVPCPA